MNKDGFYATRIYPIIFMVLVTVVFISGVSGIYLSTKDRVELNETIFQKMAVLYAAGIDYPEGDPQGIQRVYEQHVSEVAGTSGSDEEPRYFELKLPDGETGYAVFTRGAGLWGEIVAIFGFEQDLQTITGVEFVEQNETPGLGARITEDWFKQQFRGKRGPFEMVEEGTADEVNELDAITGATRTSDAVLKIANRATDTAQEKVKGE
ncbi:MAG TPA: FMN-binding protein [Sediminispirochaeta sp.]|nr:FMN-binding protein [Sediminispirochaeta sp.]